MADDYVFVEGSTVAPEGSLWCVYHFRGELDECFDTEREAIDHIRAKTVPSEWYREAT